MDAHHLEQEYKLTATNASVLDAVWQSDWLAQHQAAGSLRPTRLFHGRYMDISTFKLSRQSWSLRARREGDQFRAALKLKSRIENGFLQCEEYEADISDWLTTAADLPDSPLKTTLLTAIPINARLHMHVEVKMQRQQCMLNLDGTQVELSTDTGTIHARNGKFATLHEIELEIKSGAPDALTPHIEHLLAKYSLSPSQTSKHRIGMNLLQSG